MLLAAFEKVNITPFDLSRCYLAGFNPNRKAKGVLDPLWARILYLTDGKKRLALVICDLIGMPNHIVQEIRSRVPELNSNEVHIFCTHVHSGPDMLGLWGPAILNMFPYSTGVDGKYQEWIISEIAYGIRLATMHAKAVKPYFVQEELDNEINGMKMIDNVQEEGFFEKNISMLILKAADGEGVAALCHVTAHPETLWKTNRLVSSDFFEPLRRELESALDTNVLVFNGAIGGMVTSSIHNWMRLPQRYVWMELTGKKFADQFAQMAKAAGPIKIDSIDLRTKRLSIPLENELLYFLGHLGVLNKPKNWEKVISTEVMRVKLGPIEILGLPGEILPAVGEEVKKLSKAEYPLVLSLANDEIGYILPSEYFDNPKYSYERSMSLGRNTAEMLLEALKSIG